ncbi:MAG: nucleotidyl transferase AbiEii/AbiGii toxin family protein [Phycisphaeraceae bacterium]|nr:nucleotidyl transferase AbiEii/AbiGii toxin family protein [Phycisphaeraceae bacterium]
MLGDFWGGFKLEFKVIPRADFDRLGADQRRLRTNALSLGRNEQRAFRVDLSKHEYVEGKVARELDGYTVYMYSPLMIVCEKIRAICQQMPEYRRVVRSASARGRARDFFDIHYLVTTDGIRLDTEAAHRTLRGMFDVKRVPLWLIGRISEHRDFHRESFEALKDTVLANHALLDFDTYVEFVVAQLQPLQPLWEEQPPLG